VDWAAAIAEPAAAPACGVVVRKGWGEVVRVGVTSRAEGLVEVVAVEVVLKAFGRGSVDFVVSVAVWSLALPAGDWDARAASVGGPFKGLVGVSAPRRVFEGKREEGWGWFVGLIRWGCVPRWESVEVEHNVIEVCPFFAAVRAIERVMGDGCSEFSFPVMGRGVETVFVCD
jgi:hypothetical protein